MALAVNSQLTPVKTNETPIRIESVWSDVVFVLFLYVVYMQQRA